MLLLLFLYFAFVSSQLDTLHYKNVLKLKCDAYPGRSMFHQSYCYFVIDADSKNCSDFFPAFKVATRQLSDAKLKQMRFLREGESSYLKDNKTYLDAENQKNRLCVSSSSLYCPPDSELINTKCFYLNKNKKTNKEAFADCEYKGMKMFYPHSDEDIEDVMAFAASSKINEIWLSAVKQASGLWEMNDNLSKFDFAKWFDTTLLTSSSKKKLFTKLAVGSNSTTPLGYMSVVQESSTIRLSSMCSGMPSTEPFRETKCPPDSHGERTWFKSAGNGYTKNSLCYRVGNIHAARTKPYPTFIESKEWFARQNATPALILSLNDNEAVVAAINSTIKESGLVFPPGVWNGFYIGLKDISNNPSVRAQYRWGDTNYALNYTNWWEEKPYRGEKSYLVMCTKILYNTGFKWKHEVCESENIMGTKYSFGIICSRESQ